MSAEAEPSGVSCLSKANGTTPPETTGTNLDEYGVEPTLTKWDWTLPGLGEPGPKCESNAVPPGRAICPTGDSIRYEPLRCRKVECPNCYRDEQIERAFRIVVEIEAYARVHDERPHTLTASVPPDEAGTWTYEKLNTKLYRRGYRRMRRQSEVVGGYSIGHPWRIPKPRKKQLKRRGYGVGGEKGGLWNGVRDDALDLGDPRKYATFGPHLHNIGFPEWIEPHEGDDFIVQKHATLDDLGDVVGHVRYLLNHRGIRDGEEVGRSVRAWGAFHHASDGWDGAEEELSAGEYADLAGAVAARLGREFDPSTGELVPGGEPAECPECGTPVDEFHDLRDLPDLVDGKGDVEPWISKLPADRRAFFEGLFEEWRKSLDDPEQRGVEIDADQLQVPESVAVWSVEHGAVSLDGAQERASEPVEASGRLDQETLIRRILDAASVGGAHREELVEEIDTEAERIEAAVETLLRKGQLMDVGIGRVEAV